MKKYQVLISGILIGILLGTILGMILTATTCQPEIVQTVSTEKEIVYVNVTEYTEDTERCVMSILRDKENLRVLEDSFK